MWMRNIKVLGLAMLAGETGRGKKKKNGCHFNNIGHIDQILNVHTLGQMCIKASTDDNADDNNTLRTIYDCIGSLELAWPQGNHPSQGLKFRFNRILHKFIVKSVDEWNVPVFF